MKWQVLLKDCRNHFIAYEIRRLVESGITNTQEIKALFKTNLNPSGLSTQTIIRAVKLIFQVDSWAAFLTLCDAPLTPQSLVHLSINDFKDVGGESLEEYRMFMLKSKIIKGYDVKEIPNLPDIDLSLRQVQDRIYKEWGSMELARKELVGPILALCLKNQWKSSKIVQEMEFFRRKLPNSKSSDAVRHYCANFFNNLNPTDVIRILNGMTLSNFLSAYI